MIRTALLLLACALAACKGYRAPHFDAPQKLGGQVVPAGVLTSGARAYALYCRSCHGDKGDGKGTAARGLRPPPRDFTLGMFKFGAVPAGSLPHDEDLERIVRTGLHGTAMLAWDGIPQPTVREIIQYVKTFSPRWKISRTVGCGMPSHASMAVPCRPVRTIRSRSSSCGSEPAGTAPNLNIPRVKSRGGGRSPLAAVPFPSPLSPWHERQYTA